VAEQLTVVTVTHNSGDELPKLLRSIARYLPGCRVIVVDCASQDDSVAQAERHSADRVVALAENVGFGRGCNRGLELVESPVTALLNPDVELLDGSLLELATQALRSDRPARLLAPSVLNPDGSRQQTVHPLPVTAADALRSLVPPAAVPGRLGTALAPWRSDRPRSVGWAVGAALVARTETLRALGPFDESIFMYCEDLELGWRAGQQGVETWLWPSARVLHRGAHASLKAFGGEAFERLALARHDVVEARLGPRGAAVDDLLQGVTFGSRAGLKRVLGRPAARERRQLSAVISLRRGKAG
jgi:N-acetylglucosaminyl-diphospho-decaprenol L-rhamnosyltransferase